MHDRILLPLDGSRYAEEIVPYAVGLARSAGVGVTLLQAVQHDGELEAAEEHVLGLAQRLGAEGEVVKTSTDAASAIAREMERRPGTLVAMTTHGRSGLLETILGSVALSVVQDVPQPVLIYRPRGDAGAVDLDREVAITRVVTPLDGSEFSERMLPNAVEVATTAKAALTLVQVVSPGFTGPPLAPRGDVLEYTYVHRWAERIGAEYGIDVEWDVLHGEPGGAICRYVDGQGDVMLAMSTHARPGLKEAIFGSVTHECVRRAGVPILVWGGRTSST